MDTRTVIAGLMLCAPLASCACERQSPAPAATGKTQATHAGEPDGVSRADAYTGIRGVVTTLPVPGNRRAELKIQHEQIPEFRNKDGDIPVNMRGVPGMASMTMPFPVAEGVDISTLAVGDKVLFDFTVYWGADTGTAWEITRFEKLDPATELDFTNTTVADGTDDQADAETP